MEACALHRKLLFKWMKKYILFLFVLSFPLLAKEFPKILLDATSIKQKSNELFLDGRLPVDLNGNKSKDYIDYTYSDLPPKLVFDVTVDNEKYDLGLICDSIGIFKENTKGMKDVFCGPESRLIWNGLTYEVKGEK
jgi:hypothetical protein